MSIQHASHSSISSYLRCSKAFELEKIKGYPTKPAWWLIGGSAVHAVTEAIDRGDCWADVGEMALDCLYDEINQAYDVEPDASKWLAAGWGKSQQRLDHWAPKVVQYASQWFERDWPAEADVKYVELDVSMELPSGVVIKGFVDRVWISHDEGLIEILDLKSGSTRPDSDQQLGIYRVLVDEYLKRNAYFGSKIRDYTVVTGNYMFKDDTTYWVDTSNWNLETVDSLVRTWYAGISEEVYLPNRGSQCDRCGLKEACFLASGDTPTTRLYDSLNPNYGEVNG